MLYKLFYKCYFLLPFSNESLLMRGYARFFKEIVPIIFYLCPIKPRLSFKEKKESIPVVISLTSYPGRINLVSCVIEALLRQTVQPKTIVLWLSNEEFPSDFKLPRALQKLQKRGLTVRWVSENLKPHKKYFYVFKAYPNCNVVTVDDDEYYPPDLLASFLTYHQLYPHCIIATRARKIKYIGDKLAPYHMFENIKTFHSPHQLILPIGCGGVFYPINSLDKKVFNKNLILRFSLLCDDLWLKFKNSNQQNYISIWHCFKGKPFIPLLHPNGNSTLSYENISGSNNDKVLADLQNLGCSFLNIN